MKPVTLAIIGAGLYIMVSKTAGKMSEREKLYTPMLNAAETKYGIPSGLLVRIARVESAFNPDALGPVTKSGRAVGLMQIMPSQHPGIDARNPATAADYAGKYLAQLARMFGGNWADAVAAYNAGPGRWQAVKAGKQRPPVETSNYIKKVFT